MAAEAGSIPLPGNPQERANTTTPLPPGGDQCSYSPDALPELVDVSFPCYGHDLCRQNNSYDGVEQTERGCNGIFLDNMRAECDEQNTGFGAPSPSRRASFRHYFTVVSAVSAVSDVGAPGG